MGIAQQFLVPSLGDFDPYWVQHNLAQYDIQFYARTMEPMFQIGRLYQDVALTMPCTAAGQPCAGYGDQSAYARHVIQATLANRPTVQLATFPDGQQRPVLGYDGGDWLGNAAPGALLRATGGATLVTVVQTSTPANIRFSVAVANGVATSSARAALGHGRVVSTDIDGGGRRLDADAFQSVQSGAGTISAGAWRVQAVRISYATAEIWLYHNLALSAYSNAFQTAGATSDTDSVALAVGSVYGNASYAITGQQCETLILGAAIPEYMLLRYIREYARPYWGLVNIP